MIVGYLSASPDLAWVDSVLWDDSSYLFGKQKIINIEFFKRICENGRCKTEHEQLLSSLTQKKAASSRISLLGVKIGGL